jgi:hypothetical protein
MKEYIRLVDLILSRGHKIEVWYEEDKGLSKSTNRAKILEAVEATDIVEIVAYAPCGGDGDRAHWKKVFWAMLVPYGIDDEETVADYTDNGYYEPAI